MVAEGVQALLEDIEWVRQHQCRPAKFAEHASTAADFCYQTQQYEAAEQTLLPAIQVWVLFRTNTRSVDIYMC